MMLGNSIRLGRKGHRDASDTSVPDVFEFFIRSNARCQ